MNDSSILSIEEANKLVEEHKGWTESIAKSVARSWNLSWQSDGLDGAAFEALIFCSRRFTPGRGVPFKGYARRRIHEASTEAARKSKGWKRGMTKSERLAREVSADLLNVYPQIRQGFIPYDESAADEAQGSRAAIQQLLVSASILAAKGSEGESEAEQLVDYKKMVTILATLEPIHQEILWKIYWGGFSLRGVAGEWGTDELNVIREHKVLLQFMQKAILKGPQPKPPRIRPGLKDVALKRKKKDPQGIFRKLAKKEK